MNDIDEKEWLLNQIIRQFMKDQQSESTDNDNSFIYLEKKTLSMLMVYLLMNAEPRTFSKVDENAQAKIVDVLEQAILENKKDFEEIIASLKERL